MKTEANGPLALLFLYSLFNSLSEQRDELNARSARSTLNTKSLLKRNLRIICNIILFSCKIFPEFTWP